MCLKRLHSIVSLADLLKVKAVSFELDLPGKAVGYYTLRHLGRLSGSAYLGFHPKLEFTHWKSETFTLPWDETSHLEIGYEKKRVVGLKKYMNHPSVI